MEELMMSKAHLYFLCFAAASPVLAIFALGAYYSNINHVSEENVQAMSAANMALYASLCVTLGLFGSSLLYVSIGKKIVCMENIRNIIVSVCSLVLSTLCGLAAYYSTPHKLPIDQLYYVFLITSVVYSVLCILLISLVICFYAKLISHTDDDDEIESSDVEML